MSTLHELRRLRESLGTKTAAEKLGIPAPSLRRILSTKRVPVGVARRIEVLQSGARAAKRLERVQKELGPREAARALGVTPRTVQRSVQLGRVSKKLEARLSEVEERRAIAEEPATRVPGYGPQKRHRLLLELGARRAKLAEEFQELKNTRRSLKRLNAKIPAELRQRIQTLLTLDHKYNEAERKLGPQDSLAARLAGVKNIEQEASAIAQEYNVSARSIYCLFFSPPSLGVATPAVKVA